MFYFYELPSQQTGMLIGKILNNKFNNKSVSDDNK